MLTKFETKSNRVKGLSFHPKRPWILASLHSGVIQLWDYKMGALLDRFDEHDGPVRGIDFHRSQPLFVSGGDDYKIKVWNYKMRRCLFTLLGHLDYIRTVDFHPEYPWIVSASDDQTIRIWNWQSRSCISVLTGHNHYVMCASFHMKDDLVVSASLDQTVRVWDIAGLRKKTVAPADDVLRLPQMNADLWGGGDAIVKYVLEGHDRGVNWASFHPSLPLIVSGADDRQVKLWRMNESKAWEVDTLRGHSNNVSCVLFHVKQDIIVSNSEDKSIRVWDMSKRTGVQTFRREHDRFWILSNHPDQNLLAAGHDSGLIVFKLERERPAFVVHQQMLYYVRDRYLRAMEFSTGRENTIIPVRRAGTVGSNQAPRTLSYNPAENAILIHSDIEGGSYELFMLPDAKSSSSQEPSSVDGKRGLGSSAVFVARNRFAILDKGAGQILIKNLSNEVTKKCPPPCASTDALFYAGTGSLICRAEDRVVLFDIQQRAAVAELSSPLVKYVVWRSDMEYVALISKHAIIVANKKLKHICTVHETMRIKGGAWDDNGVFIYTTLNHIKYCLPNGDTGIIRTLETPVYITKVFGNALFCLDREGKNRQIQIDTSEYTFKLALLQKKYDQVVAMIRNSQLCGQSIIAYLQQKGFPEIALHFVGDESTRFNLAIDCGNIEAALESAKALDSKEVWHRLGVEALRQGNLQIVEFAYQKTKNFERLSFLYLITGNVDKLSKMLKIAEMRNDVMGQFHNALYLGDLPGRIKILEESGHLPLAYVAARQHGLDEDAERLSQSLNLEESPQLAQDLDEAIENTTGGLMMPPQPILHQENWPLLTISRGIFDSLFADGAAAVGADEGYADGMDGDAGWGGDDIELPGEEGEEDDMGIDIGGDAEGDDDDGWEMEDLDLPPDALISAETISATAGGPYIPPTPGIPLAQRWAEKSSIAGECAAVGAFDTAMRLLNRQIGAVNFEPLKIYMMELYMASHAYTPGVPSASTSPILAPLGRESGGPALAYKLSHLEESLRKAYKQFSEGKFSDAHKTLKELLLKSFLVVVESRKEVDDVKELQTIAREYCNWLLAEQARKELGETDPKRNQELIAYMTHCNLQPFHIQRTLLKALAITFKLKNFGTAASFCRRLLEYNPSPTNAQKARQVLAACEKNGLKDAIQLDYDSRNPFVLCSASLTPIYRGNKFLRCNASGAYYCPEYKDTICVVSNVGKIGLDSSGLLCSPSQVRG